MPDALLPDGLGAGAAAVLVGGLAMLAVLGLHLPVAVLIPVHGLVQLGSNLGRVFVQIRSIAWAAVRPFLLGSVLGAFLGAQVVVALPEAVLQTALGLFILVLTHAPMPRLGRLGARGFAVFGFLTTVLTMFFGATGPINAGVFAQTFDDRRTMVGTMAANFADRERRFHSIVSADFRRS